MSEVDLECRAVRALAAVAALVMLFNVVPWTIKHGVAAEVR